MRRPTGHEPLSDFTGGVEFSASKRPCSGDGVAGSTIRRGFRFEDVQHVFRAVRRPRCDQTAIGFAQRLRRNHAASLPH